MHLFKFVKEKAKIKMHKIHTNYKKIIMELKSKKVTNKIIILLPVLSNMLNTQSQE